MQTTSSSKTFVEVADFEAAIRVATKSVKPTIVADDIEVTPMVEVPLGWRKERAWSGEFKVDPGERFGDALLRVKKKVIAGCSEELQLALYAHIVEGGAPYAAIYKPPFGNGALILEISGSASSSRAKYLKVASRRGLAQDAVVEKRRTEQRLYGARQRGSQPSVQMPVHRLFGA